jgi:hypothetical protein
MTGTTKRLPPTLTTPLTRPPAGVRVPEAPESIVYNATLQRTSSGGNRPNGSEEHAQFQGSGMRSTSGKFIHQLPGQEDGEINGSMLGTELRTWKKDTHGPRPEANGNHVSTQVLSSDRYLIVLDRPLFVEFLNKVYVGGWVMFLNKPMKLLPVLLMEFYVHFD